GRGHDFQVLFDRLRVRSFSRGGLVATVVQPLVFFAIFYCTFAVMLDEQGIEFGRFVTPTVLVQALMFVAIGSATDLAADRSSGFFSRLLTSPVDMGAMSLAHLAVVALQGLLSSVAVVLAGHLAGFRFDHGGVFAALGFVLFAALFTVALSLATATIALRLRNLEALSAVLHLPYLPLLVLSTGFVEADLFPRLAPAGRQRLPRCPGRSTRCAPCRPPNCPGARRCPVSRGGGPARPLLLDHDRRLQEGGHPMTVQSPGTA
ncbi:ABC transporter permease, partial [Streptomyces sp. SID7803]|nr:ABC transporter permease [Streptomyces sp. SID7803]